MIDLSNPNPDSIIVMSTKRFNKKYYTKEGQVNVKKVCNEVDGIYLQLRELYNIKTIIQDRDCMNIIVKLEMRIIDLEEDLKGNFNED